MEQNKQSWGAEVRNFGWDLSLLVLGFLLGVISILMVPGLFPDHPSIGEPFLLALTLAAAIAIIYCRPTSAK
jgi:hypothetical protein